MSAKRIYTASHHSFIDVSRTDDNFWGAMIEIEHQHPECDVKHRFLLSQTAARELADTLNQALIWLEPQPYNEKHPKASDPSSPSGLQPSDSDNEEKT